VSYEAVTFLLIGGFVAIYTIGEHFFREKRPFSSRVTAIRLVGGIAWMAIGLLHLLNVLQRPSAWAMFIMVACIGVLLEMLLEEAGRLPSSLAPRILFAGIMGAIAILMIVLCYITVLDVSRH